MKMVRISFITRASRTLSSEDIRDLFTQFLDRAPDIKEVSNQLAREGKYLLKSRENATYAHVLRDQIDHPIFEIDGKSDRFDRPKSESIRRDVRVDDVTYERMHLISAVSGFSFARLARLAVAESTLRLRPERGMKDFKQHGTVDVERADGDPQQYDLSGDLMTSS